MKYVLVAMVYGVPVFSVGPFDSDEDAENYGSEIAEEVPGRSWTVHYLQPPEAK